MRTKSTAKMSRRKLSGWKRPWATSTEVNANPSCRNLKKTPHVVLQGISLHREKEKKKEQWKQGTISKN